MLRLRGKSSLGELCELGFEPQRARENGRKSSRMLRLRGKSSLGDLCELGGDIFILRGELLVARSAQIVVKAEWRKHQWWFVQTHNP